MPHIDIDELKQGRKAFTKDEWLDILLRSIGMEPDEFTYREKWLLLTRMIPLVENNFNLCELGPRSTGKSHLYKEISPNSILISGGQTTVANLFYNMGRKTVGLVGLWDCVASVSYTHLVVFQAKTLQTDADIDDYVEKIRSQLKQLLKNCDEIKLN